MRVSAHDFNESVSASCDEIACWGSFDGVKSDAEADMQDQPPRDSGEQVLALIA
jgi:hypothetical protein